MSSPLTRAPRRGFSLRRWVPYALLALGAQFSVGAAWFVSSTERAEARASFVADAQETRQQIQNALDSYVEVVRAGTALLTASNEINISEFRGFVAGLELNERYLGLGGIGFAQQVQQRDIRAFRRAVRLDGVARFQLWPANQLPAHQAVILFEPRAGRGLPVIGFDMATDPSLGPAMDRARDTGRPVASELLQDLRPFEGIGQPDFVLFIPVYRLKAATQTLEDRRRALVGFVFSPFRLADLLPHVMMAKTPQVAFEVSDQSVGQPPARLVYRSADLAASRFTSTETVQIAGREWQITMRSFEPPAGMVSTAAQRILLIGTMFSLLLFGITRGQVHAWETTTRHETELRESERALRASEGELQNTVARERDARAQIEAADRAKDEFLATLSHELRTPLNTMLGWLNMLRTGSVREHQRGHALEVIERNARLQAQLIEDLLDVSRIVMGKVRLASQAMHVSPIVSTVLESIQPTADAKGIRLHAHLTPETGRMWGDPSRVHQIVWNLLSNAVKFTPSGGDVTVEIHQDDHYVHLCIRDTGIGIPAQFLPHMFERFRQADSSMTRAHGGVGLGLAIARDLVELHGGTIEAQSDGPNCGATFTVRFPLLAVTTDAPQKDADRPAAPPLTGVRVLIVDDDAETRFLLASALAGNGARVTTAENAGEAFQQLSTDGADVLVSDIGMPAEDGLSLMRRVRALPGDSGHIPAIALTAYARPSDRAAALEAGYQLYFTKPVELDALQAGLATLIGRHPA